MSLSAACPNCGAPVEFRFDDSFVRICDSCHSAVLRTDRGVETLGQFADLAPIESPLRLFAEGRDRTASFLLIGMAQLEHAQGGIWQEWYAKLDGSEWGWLSEAQGNYYMTYEAPDVAAPAFMALGPGAHIPLAHGGVTRDYVVTELGGATYASARGEIPYRLVPSSTFRYADLVSADGSYATIDYGDPADPAARPTVYVGRQVTIAELQLSGGEAPAPPSARDRLAATKVACPNCGGSLDIRAPGQSLRVACPYCGSMVSLETGAPSALSQRQRVPKPAIALGRTGTFAEGPMQVIGFLQRSAQIDGDWYPFEEYLLHSAAVGFRWLVSSDGHWSYVQPVAAAAIEDIAIGKRYDGVKFRRFQDSTLRVDAVLGEMYWRVTAGDQVRAEDFIAPPAMLSHEVSAAEESYSLSSYLSLADVRAALAQPDLALPVPIGVAPNQPPRAKTAVQVMSFGLMVMLALGLVLAMTAKNARVFGDTLTVPSLGSAVAAAPPPTLGADPLADPATAAGSDVVPAAYFSPPFRLAGGHNIEITFDTNVDNDWVYAAADLVEDKTGAVISVDAELEHYSGVEDGDSWSEGDRSHREMIGPVPAGDYILRVESQHGGAGGAVLTVALHQGVFRGLYLILALLVLMVPYTIVAALANSVETKRWENSTVSASAKPSSGMGIAFWGIRLVFVGIAAIISAFANSSSSSDD